MAKPFENLKVLELATVVAGPCAGRLLSDLGATVIKIEKQSGDPWRDTSIKKRSCEFSELENPIYDLYNTGKKHISVNLKTPEGWAIFEKLLSEADVFLTNVRKAGRKRMGYDYEDLKEKYPRLIYAVLDGFGDKGPDKDTPAYDTTAFWARSGFLRDQAVLPEQGDFETVQSPFSVGDTFTAFLLFGEISAALYQREHTGKGQFVKAGLFHTGVFAFSTMAAIMQRPYGEKRPMERYKHSAINRAFTCKDGKMLYSSDTIINDNKKEILLENGITDFYSDPRFATAESRNKNLKATYEKVKEIFARKTRDEWIEILRKYGLAFAPMGGFADLCEDEQAIANGFMRDISYPNGHTIKVAASPLEMEALEGADLRTLPAPPMGADNESVLKAAGYSDEEIKKLYDLGVIARKEQ